MYDVENIYQTIKVLNCMILGNVDYIIKWEMMYWNTKKLMCGGEIPIALEYIFRFIIRLNVLYNLRSDTFLKNRNIYVR